MELKVIECGADYGHRQDLYMTLQNIAAGYKDRTVWMTQLERALPLRALLRKTHARHTSEFHIYSLGYRMRPDRCL